MTTDGWADATGSLTAQSFEERATRLAREILVVDAHIDLPNRLLGKPEDVSQRAGGHFDAVRAREGGLDAAFMAVFLPSDLPPEQAYVRANQAIDLVEGLVARSPEQFTLARTPAEVREAARRGRVALPMGMENGSAIRTLADLEWFHGRGIRYVTLTHADNNPLADSSFAPRRLWHGLSPYGREVVAAMNRLGMMVDVSHVSDETFDQVLALSTAPVVATHSCCRAFVPGLERNLDDERIRALGARGGLLCINFCAVFLNAAVYRAEADARRAIERRWPEGGGPSRFSEEAQQALAQYLAEHPLPPATVSDVADHIDHAVRLAGIDHVGLGSDFDGIDHPPQGLEDVAHYPNLIAELLRRGYSEPEMRKIAGENLLRLWETVAEARRA